jgi:hypothetical protein
MADAQITLPSMCAHEDASLYLITAEQAQEGSDPGETLTTKGKETLDNDAEAFIASAEGAIGV